MPKILIVEDNEMNRDMLTRRLQRHGFEICVAIDGASGIGLPHIAMPGIKLEPGRYRPASGLAGAQRRPGQMLVARSSLGLAVDSRARSAA